MPGNTQNHWQWAYCCVRFIYECPWASTLSLAPPFSTLMTIFAFYRVLCVLACVWRKICSIRTFVWRFYVFILKLVKASWTLIDERSSMCIPVLVDSSSCITLRRRSAIRINSITLTIIIRYISSTTSSSNQQRGKCKSEEQLIVPFIGITMVFCFFISTSSSCMCVPHWKMICMLVQSRGRRE